MQIVFAMGMEKKVSVLQHQPWSPENHPELEALYEEIEKGCPVLLREKLAEGVIYQGEFAGDPVSVTDVTPLQTFQRRYYAS
jgi:hypothetical protein